MEPPGNRRSIRIIPPQRPSQPAKENDTRLSETTQGDHSSGAGGDRDRRSDRTPAIPRRHTADPTSDTSARRQTKASQPAPFSCRRWRKLTGKVPDTVPHHGDRTTGTGARPANPPPPWSLSSSAATTSFVPISPSSIRADAGRTSSPVRGRSVQYHKIDRFDSRVMKQLVDKAYGITTSHHTAQQFPLHHGTRAAQRQFIHDQVYLPSVHRTLDYLDRTRDVSATPRSLHDDSSRPRPLHDHYSPLPVTQPARPSHPGLTSTKLLSAQLQTLQAELLDHYERERAATATTPDKVWRPHPPRGAPLCSTESSRSRPDSPSSSMASFRAQRHAHAKPSERTSMAARVDREDQDRDDEDGGTTHDDERESVLVLTESDTYSLSSGADADSEMEEPTPPVQVEQGSSSASPSTASWASLESHVLLALDGSDAAQIGSVREPLVVVSDSDDVSIYTDTSSEQSIAERPSPELSESVLLPRDDGLVAWVSSTSDNIHGAHDGAVTDEPAELEESHVIFLDNGVRVNVAGTDAVDHVVFLDNGVRVHASGQAFAAENELEEAFAMLQMTMDDGLFPPSSEERTATDELNDRELTGDREHVDEEASTRHVELLESAPTTPKTFEIHEDESDSCGGQEDATEHLGNALPTATGTHESAPLEPAEPRRQLDGLIAYDVVHRDSVSSTAAYDDAEFDDLDGNDAGSSHEGGYESCDE